MAERRRAGLTQEERAESLLADIEALPGRRTHKPRDLQKVATDFPSGPYSILIEAAKIRRLSLSAYIRRATYAMACHDMGIPLADALSRDPRMSRETGFAVEDPDGTKFGAWEIERLVGEDE